MSQVVKKPLLWITGRFLVLSNEIWQHKEANQCVCGIEGTQYGTIKPLQITSYSAWKFTVAMAAFVCVTYRGCLYCVLC